MMTRIKFFLIISMMIASSQYSQNISLGISTKALTSFSVENNSDAPDYDSFVGYGVSVGLQFQKPLPLLSGIQGYYGKKNIFSYKPDINPNLPDGVGPLLGIKVDIELISFEIPILYRLHNSNLLSLDIGVRLGLGRFKRIDTWNFIDEKTGVVFKSNIYSMANTQFYYSPCLEINIVPISQISLSLGVEYLFYKPTLTYESNLSETSVEDPRRDQSEVNANSSEYVVKYNMNGLQFRVGINYLL